VPGKPQQALTRSTLLKDPPKRLERQYHPPCRSQRALNRSRHTLITYCCSQPHPDADGAGRLPACADRGPTSQQNAFGWRGVQASKGRCRSATRRFMRICDPLCNNRQIIRHVSPQLAQQKYTELTLCRTGKCGGAAKFGGRLHRSRSAGFLSRPVHCHSQSALCMHCCRASTASKSLTCGEAVSRPLALAVTPPRARAVTASDPSSSRRGVPILWIPTGLSSHRSSNTPRTTLPPRLPSPPR
jgi:hypothetical protein